MLFVFSLFKEQNVIPVEEKNFIAKTIYSCGSKCTLKKYKKPGEMAPPSALGAVLQHASSINGTSASQT